MFVAMTRKSTQPTGITNAADNLQIVLKVGDLTLSMAPPKTASVVGVTADDVRRIALSLPATVQKPSYGTPGFRVNDGLFSTHREEGDVLVVWTGDLAEKEALIPRPSPTSSSPRRTTTATRQCWCALARWLSTSSPNSSPSHGGSACPSEYSTSSKEMTDEPEGRGRSVRSRLRPRSAGASTHFARYVDDGRLPGWQSSCPATAQIAHLDTYGQRDMEAGTPVELDTLWRIYSMTKPITSVAAMMLWEEGAFELKDPVARFLPAFADAARLRGRLGARSPSPSRPTEPMRMWHLLTHTSGLTYGFHLRAPGRRDLYRARRLRVGRRPPGIDLAGVLRRVGASCRCCSSRAPSGTTRCRPTCSAASSRSSPASRSTSSSRERILEPLGMADTGFFAPDDDHDRLAALYAPDPRRGKAHAARRDRRRPRCSRPSFLGGGGGLVSTAADYLRFTQMLLRGGELDGVRLLGTRTVAT